LHNENLPVLLFFSLFFLWNKKSFFMLK
jgi:hypothetical protein